MPWSIYPFGRIFRNVRTRTIFIHPRQGSADEKVLRSPTPLSKQVIPATCGYARARTKALAETSLSEAGKGKGKGIETGGWSWDFDVRFTIFIRELSAVK